MIESIQDEVKLAKYKDFADEMIRVGWTYKDNILTKTLSHIDTSIVHTYPVEKYCDVAKVVDITCPSGLDISICGLNHCGIDLVDFFERNSMKYSIPHFFSIRCKDNYGRELSSDIRFFIRIKGPYDYPIYPIYGNLSQTIGSRFKRKSERFYFPLGINLFSSESLSFYVRSPDIDIEKTELLMTCTIWEKNK